MKPAAAADRPRIGLLVIGLGASLPPLDLAVNIAFPAISAAFELQTESIRWVVAAYVVSYASLMLAFGSLGDVVGYRRIFRAGLVLGAVAFVLCGLAPDYGWLLAARSVQGVAAALLLSCAPALATSLFEESRRLWVLGAYASMGAAAGVLAPLLGGASIAVLGWAGVFWFRAPIALLTLLLLRLLPSDPPPRTHAQRRFDAAGAPLLAAGIALALLAPTLVQSSETFRPALLCALGGAVLLGAFVLRQRGAQHPFMPRVTVRDPAFVLLNLASAAVHCAGFAIPLLVPYFLARITGYGPVESGAVLTVWPIGMLLGSALTAKVARRFGRGPALWLGGALVAGGQLAVGAWGGMTHPLLMLPGLLLHGAGIGLFQVAYTDIVIAALPQQDRGVAGSLTILTRTIGIMIGAAALSAGLQYAQAQQLAAGALPKDAFLAAFQAVLRISALGFAVFFALACIRRAPGATR